MIIGYEIINDIDTDNIMGIHMSLDLPSNLVPTGVVVVQDIAYRKVNTYGDWNTVSCKTEVGGESEVLNYKSYDTSIEKFEGATYDEAAADYKTDADSDEENF